MRGACLHARSTACAAALVVLVLLPCAVGTTSGTKPPPPPLSPEMQACKEAFLREFYRCDAQHNQIEAGREAGAVHVDASNFAKCLLDLAMDLAHCSHMSVDVLDSITATVRENAERVSDEEILPSVPLDPSIPVELHNVFLKASKKRLIKAREISRSIHIHKAERNTLLIMTAFSNAVRRINRESLYEEMRDEEKNHQQYMEAINAMKEEGAATGMGGGPGKVRFTAMAAATESSTSLTVAVAALAVVLALSLLSLCNSGSRVGQHADQQGGDLSPGATATAAATASTAAAQSAPSLLQRLLPSSLRGAFAFIASPLGLAPPPTPKAGREMHVARAQLRELESLRRIVSEQREEVKRLHAAEENASMLQGQMKRLQASCSSRDAELESFQKRLRKLQQELQDKSDALDRVQEATAQLEERERETRRQLDERDRRLFSSQQMQLRTDQLLKEERQRNEQLRAELEHSDMTIQDLGNEISVAGLKARLCKLEAATQKTRTLLLEAEIISRVKSAARALEVHETDRGICKICMDRAVSVAIVPCGHVCVCTGCASPLQLCPICRIGIKSKISVFFA